VGRWGSLVPRPGGHELDYVVHVGGHLLVATADKFLIYNDDSISNI
jgi:hypothetical protein